MLGRVLELSRKLTAKIRGLEIDIESSQYLHSGGLDSGVENNVRVG